MTGLSFSIITDPEDIEVLRNKKSSYKDIKITYDEETLDLLKKNINREDSLYLIVKQGEEFVAFCSVDSEWWESGYFFIREIFVEPDFQRQQIGEKLMKKCIEHAQQKHAAGVVTETAFENHPMKKLCAKLGFKEWDNPQWKKGITYKLML
jgi:ribosomal protein S18 acetylase RimI-like enzyme